MNPARIKAIRDAYRGSKQSLDLHIKVKNGMTNKVVCIGCGKFICECQPTTVDLKP